MAYALDDSEENKQNQNAQQQPNVEAPPTTSSAPGSGPGSSTGKATPQSTPAQPFQNLQSYLTANQPQVAQQANKIAGDLTSQYGQTKSAIDQGKTDFSNQVNMGYAKDNPDIVKNATTSPTDFVNDPNNVKAFQALYNDTYSGPNNFEGTDAYGNLSGQVNKAITNAQGFTSNEGIQNYFQSNNPNATKGGNVLDSVLLQGSPEAFGKVTETAKGFQGLSDYLGNTTTAANADVSAARENAKKISDTVRNQFVGDKGVIPTFQSDLNNRVNQAQATAKADADKNQALLKSFQGLDLNDAKLMGSLGFTPEEISKLKIQQDAAKDFGLILDPGTKEKYLPSPIDFSTFASPLAPETNINTANLASADDYKKAAAFSQLTGEDLSSFLNPNNINQAGTANPNLLNFNKSGALDYSSNKIKAADEKILGIGDYQSGLSRNKTKADIAENKPEWDALVTGKIGFNNPNKDAEGRSLNDRQKEQIKAAIREGLYTPPPGFDPMTLYTIK